MHRFIIRFLLLTLACPVLADTSYGELTGESARVFMEGAALFESPRETSSVICPLPLGTELHRLAAIDMQYQGDGISSSWMEGTCQLDGETYRGYIPQPWLALTDQVLSGDTLFMFGIGTYYPDIYRFVGSARIVYEGDILWESVFYPPSGGFEGSDYRYGVSSRQIDPVGFTRMQDLVVVTFTYEACGFENRDVLFAWTGNYLIRGPSASMVSEAGLFHYTEDFIFPGEDFPGSDWVRVLSTEEEFSEESMEYFVTSLDTTYYSWNGLEFTQL